MLSVFPKRAAAAMAGRAMSTEIKTVGVVGMGLMGHGIVQAAAEVGYKVVACDMNPEALAKGMSAIEQSAVMLAGKAVKKGKMDQDAADAQVAATLGNITGTSDIGGVSDCDLIVEAIIEDLGIKKSFYEQLGKDCGPNTIFASNTSSFPIGEIGDASGRPDKMTGLHFFNPVQLMKLVEVVRTPHTSDEAFDAVFAFAQSLPNKVPVKCKDTPGFIVNRLLVPYMGQALAMVDRGDASPEDIDLAMQLGAGHPMGPIHLSDYVGLDINLAVLSGWMERYPEESSFFVPDVLREKCEAGDLGRKTGQGFYKWEGNKKL